MMDGILHISFYYTASLIILVSINDEREWQIAN